MKPPVVFPFLINLYLIQLVKIVGIVSGSISVLYRAFVDSCDQHRTSCFYTFITFKVQIWMMWIQMYKRDKITDSFEWQLHIKPRGGLTDNEYRY